MLLRSTARPIICGTSELLLRQRITFVSGRQAIFRRQSSSNTSSTSDDSEWIPPSRPLSGDQANYEHIVSKSHLSQTKLKKEGIEVTEETRIVEATVSRTSPYDTDSSWADYGEASTSEEEDEEDDFEDIDISDEDLLNEENWIDPFERGNLSKHHFGQTVDIDEWMKGMPSREEAFTEDEDMEDDNDDDAEQEQILNQWLNEEKKRQKQAGNTLMGHELLSNTENMTEEEIIANFKKHGTWVDLDQISTDDLQRMVDEMKQNHPTSPSDTVPKSQDKGRKITTVTSKVSTGSMEKDEDIALPDWTVARQKRLGRPSAMLTPRDARMARQLDGEIPIKLHTLLTCEEITSCLKSLGGWDVTVLPIPLDANMGKAIIVATGTSGTHLRTMADALVKSLRARKLHKMGVIGADSGAEGYDCDDWIAVDCRNYTVHLQNEFTRKHIALDHHWSPAEISKRRRNPIKLEDDDAADDFVNDNPIPDEYARYLLNTDASGTMSSEEAAAVNYLNTKKLQKTTMSPVVPSRRRPKGGKKAKGSKGKRGRP